MHWFFWFDLGVAVLAVVVLGWAGYAVYQHVRTLLRAVGTASSTLGDATSALSRAQRASSAGALKR